ncbi:hypothetical protein ACU4GR_01980 [Methylobacterium oryzae CBMB20]
MEASDEQLARDGQGAARRRWIIAINRHEPEQRAVIRWDPGRAGDQQPWHVATCEHCYSSDAFTDWMPFPDLPLEAQKEEVS